MMQAQADRHLTLPTLLEELRRDEVLSKEEHESGLSIRRNQGEESLHPLTMLARQNFTDARSGKALTEDALVEWLASANNLDSYNIDPLEIDVTAVTAQMSYAFSDRHKILAVKVSKEEVVVATAEPFVTGWMADLEHTTRRMVTLKLALRLMPLPLQGACFCRHRCYTNLVSQ